VIRDAAETTIVGLWKGCCGWLHEFGKWYTVYTRFWRWAQKDVWERIFKHLAKDPDFEYVLIDATLVRVHQHGTGAKGGLKIRPSANRAAA
jgi:transposase